MAGEDAELDDFLRSTSPTFNSTATGQHLCDERIPRPREVFFRQRFDR